MGALAPAVSLAVGAGTNASATTDRPPRAPFFWQADSEARTLCSAAERIALALSRVARRFVGVRAWQCFGYARLEDHARERFGRTGRWVRDLAALGAATERLPRLAAALTGDDGGTPLGRVAALLIGRVASVESLAAWVQLARECTVRDLRKHVRAARDVSSCWPPGLRSGEIAATESPVPTRAVPGPATTAPLTPGAHGAAGEHVGRAGGLDDGGDRVLLRLPVPGVVRAAFDETLDLYRAVVGTEASTTSFVEALVGEALAGPDPPDIDRVPLRPGPRQADLEEALAQETGRWSHLGGRAVHASAELLARLDALEGRCGEGGPRQLDALVRDLVCLADEIERRLGCVLAEMSDAGAWARLRFAGVGHYAEERLGLSRSRAEERASVARLLRERPVLRRAYEEGRLGIEATLVLLRLLRRAECGGAAEAAWVERAGEVTVKRLKDECRALRRRASGADGSRESALALSPQGGASRAGEEGGVSLSSCHDAFSPAARTLAAAALPTASPVSSTPTHGIRGGGPASAPRAPAPLSDQAWLESLRRDRGTARERVRACGLAALAGRRDEEWLRLRLPEDLAADFVAAVEARRRAATAEAQGALGQDLASLGADVVTAAGRWCEEQAAPSLLVARSFSMRGGSVPAWVGLLGLLEHFVETWDPPAHGRRHAGEEVYARYGWRCAAPGCTSRRNLEDHHVVYRSRGGGDERSNRVCLCRFHHQRGEHGDLLSCRGRAPLGVLWTLGREGVGGRFRNERKLAAL